QAAAEVPANPVAQWLTDNAATHLARVPPAHHQRLVGTLPSFCPRGPSAGGLKGPDGSVSSSQCDARHHPEQRRLGGTAWRYRSGMRLAAQAIAEIPICVSQLPQMPAVFDSVLQLL